MPTVDSLRVLFIGDIVGRPGRNAVISSLHTLKAQYNTHIVIANAENAAGGNGCTPAIAAELHAAGVQAITLGDHIWDQPTLQPAIHGLSYVCRPANLPSACPGQTHVVIEHNGFKIAVISLLGRVFMHAQAQCPFLAADALISALQPQVNAIFLDLHAEATSEKVAMGWHLDGRVAAVIGTHTHIPTADARILPLGTAYMTDAGMTGPYHSVLGRAIAPVLGRFLDGMPRKFEVATQDVRICGCVVTLCRHTGKALAIEPIQYCISDSGLTHEPQDIQYPKNKYAQ